MIGTVAKYIRLSSEDDDLGESGKPESNSVTNQRNLLDAFISHTPISVKIEVTRGPRYGRLGI